MANGISGARLLIVPESGHLSPLEQPTAVTQALIDRLGTPMAPGDN
jgi:pimeloyl-ACP methyl ester carboxylesterase